MGQCYSIKHTSFSSKRERIVLQRAFKLNIAVATAETWHLKGHVLLVNDVDFPVLLFIFTYKELCVVNVQHLKNFISFFSDVRSDEMSL